MTTNPFEQDTGTVAEINIKLFGATLFAVFAWLLWPTSVEWWGFGLISIILWFGSLITLVEAVNAIRKHKKRRDAIKDIEALGSQQKSSTLASSDDLEKAGMRDG